MEDEQQKQTVVLGGMRQATVKLIEKLKTGKPGDTATDAELTEACGKSTRPCEPDTKLPGEGYAYLLSAIRYCEREYGVVWRRVHGEEHIQVLNNAGKLGLASSHRKHVHRMAKRTMRVLGSVVPSELDDEAKRDFLSMSAMHGALATLTTSKAVKKLKAGEPVVADPKRLLAALLAATD